MKRTGVNKALATKAEMGLAEELRRLGAETAVEWAKRYGIGIHIIDASSRVYTVYDADGMFECVLIGSNMLYDPKNLARVLDGIASDELLKAII